VTAARGPNAVKRPPDGPPQDRPPPDGPPPDGPSQAKPTLDELRERIRRLEGGGRGARRNGLALGPEIDAHLPAGGLPLGCIHELTWPAGGAVSGAAAGTEPGSMRTSGVTGHDEANRTAAAGLAAVLAARLVARDGRPLLWAASAGARPYPPGLQRLGIAPSALVVVTLPPTRTEAWWAIEECLRCADLGAVVVDLGPADLLAAAARPTGAGAGATPASAAGGTVRPGATGTHGTPSARAPLMPATFGRRLQLAAEASGVTGFLLLPALAGAPFVGATRWRVAAAGSRTGEASMAARVPVLMSQPPASEEDGAAAAAAVWYLELQHCRGGRPGAWRTVWRSESEGENPVCIDIVERL